MITYHFQKIVIFLKVVVEWLNINEISNTLVLDRVCEASVAMPMYFCVDLRILSISCKRTNFSPRNYVFLIKIIHSCKTVYLIRLNGIVRFNMIFMNAISDVCWLWVAQNVTAELRAYTSTCMTFEKLQKAHREDSSSHAQVFRWH